MLGKNGKNSRKESEEQPEDENGESKNETLGEISSDAVRQKLSSSMDVIFNEVAVGEGRKFTAVFVDGMVNSSMVDDFIIKPLVQEVALSEAESDEELLNLIMLGTVYHCQRKLREKLSDCFGDLLTGSAVLIFDDSKRAVTFEIKGFEKRGIAESTNESVQKGSKESFIEVLRINTALIRRRLPTPDLIISQTQIGRRSNTAVSIVYLDGVANRTVVDEVKKRLGKIDIDGIPVPGTIESFLIDTKSSLFPQILYTERTDKFCGSILEGRVGILIDGFPLAMIEPVDINAFLQAPEDYSQNIIYSSLYRLLRYICALTAMVLPAFYVAMTTFHPEMIPTALAGAIIQSKEGVPFPSYLEVVMMLIAFEVLLEAGMRLPKSIGQAVSIVGALVVGQAAITAKILSPAVVIVIAAAGISGFVIPSQDFSNTVRILRLILVLLSMTSGLYGVSIGLVVILYRLSGMTIFGVPYLSPIVSEEGKGILTDTVIMASWRKMKKRPANISPEDEFRQGADKE